MPNTIATPDVLPLSKDERALMNHVSRWGSDGYPVSKLGRKWQWHDSHGVKGAPVLYTTKRAAVEAFERYMDLLREREGAWAQWHAMMENAERVEVYTTTPAPTLGSPMAYTDATGGRRVWFGTLIGTVHARDTFDALGQCAYITLDQYPSAAFWAEVSTLNAAGEDERAEWEAWHAFHFGTPPTEPDRPENHVRIVEANASRQINGRTGTSRALCGGEITDRDVLYRDAVKMTDSAERAKWIECAKCRDAILRGGPANAPQPRGMLALVSGGVPKR